MAGSAVFGSIDVAVRFLADASSVTKETEKVSGTGDKIKGWAKGAAVAIGGAFAIKTVSDWVGAAEEANAVSAKLTQTLANAGDSTGQWAKHAEDLAGSLQYKTGIDDEVIKGGQTILATFHDLSGAAGQQSGAFDRATKASLDMSKAGFGSVDSAATMLGKALQDPERGLTALGRAGITFSEDQKQLIKGMVESGDKAGAMNEILKNVEGQVGGVAEKSATAGDKMKVAWGETQESLGKALIPVLETLAPILQKIAQFVQENANWLVPMVAGIIALNIALSLSPITLIAIAIAALIAGIILLWQNWDTVWSAITAAFDWAVSFIVDHWQMILGIIFPFIGLLMLLWNNWDTIWGWITAAIGWAVGFIISVFQTVIDFFAQVPGWIGGALSVLADIIMWPFRWAWDQIISLWNGITGFFAKIPGWIGGALAGLGDIIKWPFQWAWDRIVEIKDGVINTFAAIPDALKAAFKGAFNFIADVWNNTVGSLSFEIPGWVPGIGGKGFDVPDIPKMAAGGIITRPTLALLGEAGPEAVVPLSDARPRGPVVHIEHVTLAEQVDVDLLMRRVAWAAQTQRI